MLKRRKVIDAMVLGADRSGSTWLRKLCIQNQDIYVCPVWQQEFLPKSEVTKRRIFSRIKFNCPMDQYQGEKIILGVRNMAIYHEDKVAKKYFSHNKNMKFLLSVRNPLERAFSLYVSGVNKRNAKDGICCTFDINKSISIEEPFVQKLMLYSLLKPYLELFSKESIFIYPMELMKQDTKYWINKAFNFLDVQEDIPLNDLQELANPGMYESGTFIPISPESKQYLVNLCMNEMEKISELSGIDLIELWNLKNYL